MKYTLLLARNIHSIIIDPLPFPQLEFHLSHHLRENIPCYLLLKLISPFSTLRYESNK